MEINTAVMLYKSLIRSMFDYGSMVYFPDKKEAAEKMEKIRFKGLRTAIGYRMSTPKNVILEEAKVARLRESNVGAVMLAQ